jgi:hypothetical protein
MNRALLCVLVVISRLRSPALPESKLPSLFWQIYGNLSLDFGAISSVVERLLHTQEVAGSNPASRIYATGKQKTVTPAILPHRVLSMDRNTITGGCLCGSIRYEATGRPYNITHCHCLDCRRSSGAPFVTWASFSRRSFRFTSGQPRELRWAGRFRSFCPDCGTPLTFLAGPDADEVDVTVCSFDQPTTVAPADHTWVEDQLPWIHLADDLPIYRQKRETHGS